MFRSKPIVGVVFAFVLSMSMWLYVDKVLVAHQRADAAVSHTPRGNLSDLYPRWLGSRELLLHGRDPYSKEITREIQAGYYGRPLDASSPGDPKDQQAFAYPVYVAFLLAPTIYLPFEPVRKAFDLFLFALTAASVWFWVGAMRWRAGPSAVLIAAMLTLGSFPAVQGIKLDQLTLLVAGLISLCAFLLTRGQLFLGGAVLAISTIKPQLVAPLTACLVLWALTNWRARKSFLWGLGSTMAVLLVASEVVLPGWIRKFWVAIHEYVSYTGGISLIDRLLSPGSSKAVSAAIVAILLALAWHLRREDPGSREFSLLLAKILAGTLLIVPTFAPYNQVVLLPAVLLTAHEWFETWRAGPIPKSMLVATVLALGWPWVAAIGLVMASLRFPIEALRDVWYAPLYTVLAIPFVLLLDLAVLGGKNRPDSQAVPKLAMSDGKL
jgi:hypothetical protein